MGAEAVHVVERSLYGVPAGQIWLYAGDRCLCRVDDRKAKKALYNDAAFRETVYLRAGGPGQ